MREKSFGNIAYDAYCDHTGGKSLISGAELPLWRELDHGIKEAWDVAAVAAREAEA
jgi:hypothetical protein